jgi:hypothetical protein
MSLEISPKIEAALVAKAKEKGISIDALLERLLIDAGSLNLGSSNGPAPEFPVWHLGVIGSLHRRDIYDDVD